MKCPFISITSLPKTFHQCIEEHPLVIITWYMYYIEFHTLICYKNYWRIDKALLSIDIGAIGVVTTTDTSVVALATTALLLWIKKYSIQ